MSKRQDLKGLLTFMSCLEEKLSETKAGMIVKNSVICLGIEI